MDTAPEANTPASFFLCEETRELSAGLGVLPALGGRGRQVDGATTLKCALPGAVSQPPPPPRPLERDS